MFEKEIKFLHKLLSLWHYTYSINAVLAFSNCYITRAACSFIGLIQWNPRKSNYVTQHVGESRTWDATQLVLLRIPRLILGISRQCKVVTRYHGVICYFEPNFHLINVNHTGAPSHVKCVKQIISVIYFTFVHSSFSNITMWEESRLRLCNMILQGTQYEKGYYRDNIIRHVRETKTENWDSYIYIYMCVYIYINIYIYIY